MNARMWISRLELVALQVAHLGIGPDLAGVTWTGLAAVYAYLARLGVTR